MMTIREGMRIKQRGEHKITGCGDFAYSYYLLQFKGEVTPKMKRLERERKLLAGSAYALDGGMCLVPKQMATDLLNISGMPEGK